MIDARSEVHGRDHSKLGALPAVPASRDPADTSVVAEVTAVLIFRVTYNPVFANEFWPAVLASIDA